MDVVDTPGADPKPRERTVANAIAHAHETELNVAWAVAVRKAKHKAVKNGGLGQAGEAAPRSMGRHSYL